MVWCKQSSSEVFLTGVHESEVNVAAFQAFRDAGPAVLDHVDLHGGMPVSVVRQEVCQDVFDVLRAAADPERAGLSALQGACPFDEGIALLQDPACAAKQIFAFRSELDPSADAIEQRNAKLSFKTQNLTRRRWLTHAQPALGAGKPAGDYKLHVDGQPAKEYKAGETFEIAPGVIHDELTGEKAAKALVVFTVEKGKPLASPAK
jgi:hypothetical protein